MVICRKVRVFGYKLPSHALYNYYTITPIGFVPSIHSTHNNPIAQHVPLCIVFYSTSIQNFSALSYYILSCVVYKCYIYLRMQTNNVQLNRFKLKFMEADCQRNACVNLFSENIKGDLVENCLEHTWHWFDYIFSKDFT